MSGGVVRVSNVSPSRSATRLARAVSQAVYDGLPREWWVLPEGRNAASVIAKAAVQALMAEGLTLTFQVSRKTDAVVTTTHSKRRTLGVLPGWGTAPVAPCVVCAEGTASQDPAGRPCHSRHGQNDPYRGGTTA